MSMLSGVHHVATITEDLDLALVVDSHDDFEEVRRRLMEEDATEGEVNDFGVALSFSFVDPSSPRLSCSHRLMPFRSSVT
ncbi:hypothetical protein BH20ACT22_BH20ACT22_12820 [soil metagenome]